MSEVAAHRLGGRTVVVTGAAGGIGRACASAAAAAGASVVLADVDAAATDRMADELAAAGAPVLGVPTDVTDEAQCAALVASAVQRFGRVDAAVLAAGVARHVPLLELSRREWDAMMAVHLTSAFLCVQALSRAMAGDGGSLVYLASSVTAGLGPLHQAHYVAAKAGALGLVRAAARELGPVGVRVNAVSPGFTDTALNAGLFSEEEISDRARQAPLGRVALPDDVVGAVMFLLDDASRFVTGQTLHVNGGTYMP